MSAFSIQNLIPSLAILSSTCKASRTYFPTLLEQALNAKFNHLATVLLQYFKRGNGTYQPEKKIEAIKLLQQPTDSSKSISKIAEQFDSKMKQLADIALPGEDFKTLFRRVYEAQWNGHCILGQLPLSDRLRIDSSVVKFYDNMDVMHYWHRKEQYEHFFNKIKTLLTENQVATLKQQSQSFHEVMLDVTRLYHWEVIAKRMYLFKLPSPADGEDYLLMGKVKKALDIGENLPHEKRLAYFNHLLTLDIPSVIRQRINTAKSAQH